MSNLFKSLAWALTVLLAGILLWLLFVGLAKNAALAMTPVGMVMLMFLYIGVFSGIAFAAHRRSVRGLPFEDSAGVRRPSLAIPTVVSIALMIFVVSYGEMNPAIWTAL